jgi:hypothetical protein
MGVGCLAAMTAVGVASCPASVTPAPPALAAYSGGPPGTGNPGGHAYVPSACGPNPVTITMTATAKVVNTSHEVLLDGGGKVTLSGGGKIRILYMNEGGQLKVVNSVFLDNRCYADGPDLGGAAIRAYGMYMGSPVYITHDTFSGNTCSNGGALSGLYANFDVTNSLLTANEAIGWGANPPHPGTPGGGSGRAIYTDGDHCNLIIDGTVMRDNSAREGGGAVFFVVNACGGTLKIEYSTLQDNPSGVFQNAPGIFDSADGYDTAPVVADSTIS